MLKWTSYETIEKLCLLQNEDSRSVAVLCASLYVIRFCLYLVNCKQLGFHERVAFMWLSTIWITSLGYSSTFGTNMMTMLANRGNIVTEAVAFIFLMVQEDVVNPHYCTTEPCEHSFAGWRCERCEATVEECISIEDKRSHKVNAIYGGKLAAHRDPC